MALDNTIQRIERSLYERVRKILVREGYWPDETSGLYPDNPTGDLAFKNALETIRNTKGFIIEPFGHSSAQSKGEKKLPRIVLLGKRFLPGTVGAPPNPQVLPSSLVEGQLDWVKSHTQTVNMHVDFHIISSNAVQSWAVDAVILEAFGMRNFIPWLDRPEDTFFIKQQNYFDIPDPVEGQEEKVYSYEITDVNLVPGETIQQNIALIQEVTLEIITNDYRRPNILGEPTPEQLQDTLIIT